METVAKNKYKKIAPELKEFIVDAIHSVLEDPDFGLKLSDEMKRRLRAAKNKKQKTVSLAEVVKKFS